MPWWDTGSWFDRTEVRYKRRELSLAFTETFDSPNGKIVLSDLANECGILKSAEGLTVERLAFEAGKRHMFTHITHKLNWLPQALPQVKNFHDITTPEEQESDNG